MSDYSRFAELADRLPTMPGYRARVQATHTTFRADSRNQAQLKAIKHLAAHYCGDYFNDRAMADAGKRGREKRYAR